MILFTVHDFIHELYAIEQYKQEGHVYNYIYNNSIKRLLQIK